MIHYCFHFDNGQKVQFDIDPLRKDPEIEESNRKKWTKLAFHRCPTCPLIDSNQSHCPAAVDVQSIVEKFSEHASSEEVLVTVDTSERSYSKRCGLQIGLSSLMGLVMATSKCPHLGAFRGMAFYHLPFSSVEETIVRTVSFYLLRKLFTSREDLSVDFSLDELKEFYQRLETINQAFFERIKAAVALDANVNAIVSFCAVSWIISNHLDDFLEKSRSILAINEFNHSNTAKTVGC